MRKTKKILSMLLMLAMLVTVFGGLTAFAADNDPNMTAYNGTYTYMVDIDDIGTGTTVDIYAVPANSSWIATEFTTSAAAANVNWTAAGGNTTGITAGTVSAYEYATGEYATCLTVDIAQGTQPGPASFKATNPASSADPDGYVDITVIVNDADNNDSYDEYELAVVYQVYEPSDPEVAHTDVGTYVRASLHEDDRSYLTVFDTVVSMEEVEVIDSYTVSPYGPYIDSMTIDSTTYEASGNDGWQYRVYTLDTSSWPFQYEVVELSEIIGIGDMDARVIDMVQWRYGSYYDTDLFPDTIGF